MLCYMIIFAIQNFMQNTKKTRELHLYFWNHVYKQMRFLLK